MTPERRPYISGNWKMFKNRAETRAYIEELKPLIEATDSVEVGLCVPFTSLETAVAAAEGSAIRICAQNMHEEDEGAYTGEISRTMLTDVGVYGVVLGHSERRRYFNETDKALQRKVPAALDAGLCPILCVGETEEEREHGDTERRLRAQVQEALEDVSVASFDQLVIAYEPVWAIGTGKVATTEQAQEAIAFIRALVAARYREGARQVRILYGGSVNADNAADILSQPDVDGALVGGASLDPGSFAQIVAAAAR
jgi:triosephosphate isomerase